MTVIVIEDNGKHHVYEDLLAIEMCPKSLFDDVLCDYCDDNNIETPEEELDLAGIREYVAKSIMDEDTDYLRVYTLIEYAIEG